MTAGYMHPKYAESLSESGITKELVHCKGWVLKRQIPNFPYYDAMGCYPIFSCQNWSKLHEDLDEIGNELVCISLVADPFGEYDEKYLARCFKDVVKPFKEHFVIDLSRAPKDFVCEHHCRYAKKALKNLIVEKCEAKYFLEDWVELYSVLIKKHDIKGIARFSRESFMKQFEVPGIVVFRASYEGETIGMTLWYVQGDIGYYHLGAYSHLGYKMRASFGIFWFAIEYFSSMGLKWLNLGGGAGLKNVDDGLTRFKRGWSTGNRTAYFCGHIFDRRKYLEITKAKGIYETDYFPAYRMGEFG